MQLDGKIINYTLKALANGQRLIAHRGGTRSGKTYSTLMVLLAIAVSKNKFIDVVSESLPHLKRGAIHDFDELLDTNNVQCEINKTDKTYSFASGSVVRFFSADDWGKVKGSRRDILFINEANRIPYETYRQLAVRTTQSIIIDWNPDSEFWFEEKGLCVEFPPFVSTYKDNSHLSDIQIAEIESNKGDQDWWNVYGLGQIGKHEGLIYKNWEQCAEIPQGATLKAIGLDFGFMNDPTAIVEVYQQNGELWLNEVCYQKGLLNNQIADILLKYAQGTIVIADSAEMKSIEEIRRSGVRGIRGVKKDSITNSIGIVQKYKLNVTSSSLNLINELRNYKWLEDKITGKLLNQPCDKFNHALDAVRYVCMEVINTNFGTYKLR